MEDRKCSRSYGWVDEKSGIARMPISEAKKLILQRGLPARADGAGSVARVLAVPAYGESSGGRTIPTGEQKRKKPRRSRSQRRHLPQKEHGQ